jgi:hypothetical protein
MMVLEEAVVEPSTSRPDSAASSNIQRLDYEKERERESRKERRGEKRNGGTCNWQRINVWQFYGLVKQLLVLLPKPTRLLPARRCAPMALHPSRHRGSSPPVASRRCCGLPTSPQLLGTDEKQ